MDKVVRRLPDVVGKKNRGNSVIDTWDVENSEKLRLAREIVRKIEDDSRLDHGVSERFREIVRKIEEGTKLNPWRPDTWDLEGSEKARWVREFVRKIQDNSRWDQEIMERFRKFLKKIEDGTGWNPRRPETYGSSSSKDSGTVRVFESDPKNSDIDFDELYSRIESTLSEPSVIPELFRELDWLGLREGLLSGLVFLLVCIRVDYYGGMLRMRQACLELRSSSLGRIMRVRKSQWGIGVILWWGYLIVLVFGVEGLFPYGRASFVTPDLFASVAVWVIGVNYFLWLRVVGGGWVYELVPEGQRDVLAWIKGLRNVVGKGLVVASAPGRAILNLSIGNVILEMVRPLFESRQALWFMGVAFQVPLLLLELGVLTLHAHVYAAVIFENTRFQFIYLKPKCV